jgi:anthranilate 1,2-dioxygenase small subunit
MSSTTTRFSDIEVGTHAQACISRLNAHYCSAIDNGDLERWPTFFADDCTYRILTRADFDAGRDFGIWFCNTRGMLLDRVSSIQSVNVFEPHVYRHVISPTEIVGVDTDGTIRCETSYMVVRTGYEGSMVVFSAGRYVDAVSIEGDAALLRERTVVTDSCRYDTLVALPL